MKQMFKAFYMIISLIIFLSSCLLFNVFLFENKKLEKLKNSNEIQAKLLHFFQCKARIVDELRLCKTFREV
ncbi:hypothetical protein EMIT079MI2_10633 [Bacillus sp. IT-79MI2]